MTLFSRSGAFAAVCVLAATVLAGAEAGARELRVSSFEPPTGFYSKQMLAAWIDRVNPQLTGGEQMRLYPGSILGAAAAQRDLVLNGVADVALIVPAYTPGLFPRTSVAEVPFIARSSREGTDILQTLLEEGLIAEEYKDFKVIGLFSTTAYNIVTPKENVLVPADIAGLRVRTPSPYVEKLMKALGATGVNMPGPQVYEALDRGVLDAAFWNIQAVDTFRLYEPARNFTDLKLSATPIAVLMNKATYDSLSEADRAVIDANSGRAFSEWIAAVGDEFDMQRRSDLVESGALTINTPSSDQAAQWRDALKIGRQWWVEDVKQQGVSPVEAEALVERATAIAEGDK